MIRAILFDMGGTLDGAGHWLERFVALYRSFGMELRRESIRRAFDEAESRSATEETIASADLQGMIDLHVKWQLAHLCLSDPRLEQHLVGGFITGVRKAAVANVRLLADLAARGLELGVVSNACGNVDKLCHDLGYATFLSVIVDSRRVGFYKPDPAIFLHAAEKLGRASGEIMMVGDSFERDIAPAKQVGMKTAWLNEDEPGKPFDASLVDLRLRRLADLPGALSSLAPAVA
ncbi:MAG TPA: HAD family hydrolase [Chthoniobacterales bacterium]|nr:HAD family hydrolase [Chthoniobacterales bacterium]